MDEVKWVGVKRAFNSYKPLLEGLESAGKRLWNGIKSMLIGTGKVAGGAAGGIVGAGQRTLDRSAGIFGAIVEAIGGAFKNYPVVMGVITAIAGYVGIKKFLKGRDKKNELSELQAANNLIEARLGNHDMRNALNFEGANTGISYPTDPNFHQNRLRGAQPGTLSQPTPRT